MAKTLKVGLALGSGGPRGFALIGVIRVLHKNKIPIDFIAGTSAGAIVGGAYAISRNLSKLESLVSSFPFKELIKILLEVNFNGGLVKGENLRSFAKEQFGNTKIEKMEVPFCAVAAEAETGKEVIIIKGYLADAIRASSSIPMLFAPFKIGKKLLIDGGVTQQVPVEIVRNMGADIVIAANLSEKVLSYNPKNAISSLQHYVLLLLRALARENVKTADVVISPIVSNANWVDNVKQRDQLIKEGERVARRALPQIRKLLGITTRSTKS
ncbi:hypothetical protein CO112_02135 [Candidatus Dojkabacteria bacterium CG_4_9_14_3_um_filter_150_Dojkabacteria_WS6_41_13]|uniref:PNPLA domain-containing protein n=1 Tax=Candidatus Dojkabacteria bacterium CG_4_10_14_0_2_um_filter_Dojkabacteria_WS6_41_15 TaxID=2014249 RepID=A0A2M7W1G4_9BACT|nr:MAG: hypothetical protein COX64_03450 [Candidatus Dojkabacteria bacterium CG_4_10_14_0_2_um_filter_Dojkabacteria_WS6_41_15]PJB22865.1 MAG: hypothetical protein CO112_02135 [Candidatus Dojkabacteria bacterium CG_4_9_14_3_um_filter_150_Dojkabacteria_WS6_41_13]